LIATRWNRKYGAYITAQHATCGEISDGSAEPLIHRFCRPTRGNVAKHSKDVRPSIYIGDAPVSKREIELALPSPTDRQVPEALV
jgi:hypothetical protein